MYRQLSLITFREICAFYLDQTEFMQPLRETPLTCNERKAQSRLITGLDNPGAKIFAYGAMVLGWMDSRKL